MSLALNPLNGGQALRQARTLVGDLSPRQRYGIGGGVLAVVVAMLLFVHFMAKPAYTLLYASLDASDAQQVASQLSGLAIPYELSTDGASISVPADLLDRARLQMAARGLPHSGQLGFELFDKTNWSGSDFAEQVNYQRALEGELERTIETIHGVQAARVHITLAHDSLFAADERGAKAAVLLTLRDGSLDPSMATAIQHLVASAVDHLSPTSVAILDASGQMSLASNPALPGAGGGLGEDRLENSLSAKILATLAPVVGAQHVRANVSVEYDPSTDDNTQETYDPSTTALLSSQRSRSGSATTGASGVPGTTSNLPAAQAAGTNFNAQLGDSGPLGQSSDSQTYAVSRTVNHNVRPAGAIQRITAAVVIDDATQIVTGAKGHTSVARRQRSPEELQQIQSLAAAAIGINPSRGDVLTVSNLAFAAPPPEAAPAAPRATPNFTDRLPTLLRWAALVGVLLCLLLACEFLLWRPARRRKLASLQAAVAAAQAQLAAAATADAKGAAAAGQTLATPRPPGAMPVFEEKTEFLNMTELLRADPEDTPPSVQRVLHLKDRLAERVKREPAVASRLVQSWMNKRGEDPA